MQDHSSSSKTLIYSKYSCHRIVCLFFVFACLFVCLFVVQDRLVLTPCQFWTKKSQKQFKAGAISEHLISLGGFANLKYTKQLSGHVARSH